MKYAKVRDVKSPSRNTSLTAGITFYVPNDFNEGLPLSVPPGGRVLVPSGIKVSVPAGYALIAFNDSDVAVTSGLVVGACVVNEDFQEEILMNVINTDLNNDYYNGMEYVNYSGHVEINPGDKLTQFILVPVNYEMPEEVTIENLY